jgi:hypothetical protein
MKRTCLLWVQAVSKPVTRSRRDLLESRHDFGGEYLDKIFRAVGGTDAGHFLT